MRKVAGQVVPAGIIGDPASIKPVDIPFYPPVDRSLQSAQPGGHLDEYLVGDEHTWHPLAEGPVAVVGYHTRKTMPCDQVVEETMLSPYRAQEPGELFHDLPGHSRSGGWIGHLMTWEFVHFQVRKFFFQESPAPSRGPEVDLGPLPLQLADHRNHPGGMSDAPFQRAHKDLFLVSQGSFRRFIGQFTTFGTAVRK